MRPSLVLCALVAALAVAAVSDAPRAAAENVVKGQSQLAGSYAKFGTTYTLKGNYNFSILRARYTLEPLLCYAELGAQTKQKLVVLDIALKNASPTDNFINLERSMTLVDAKGQLYDIASGALALKSLGSKAPNTNLKPGQGLGQPSLHDPLQIGFVIPGDARIVKIVINRGRQSIASEQVLRYAIAGATKDEAGVAGDPLNIVAPVPEYARDPADASGATALQIANGKIGDFYPSRFYALRLDALASADTIAGQAPAAGKRFIVAAVTAKYLLDNNGFADFGYVSGGDLPLYAITDSDGERYRPTSFLKAKSDDNAGHRFEPGDTYAMRVVFTVPKSATLKSFVLGAQAGTVIGYDASQVK